MEKYFKNFIEDKNIANFLSSRKGQILFVLNKPTNALSVESDVKETKTINYCLSDNMQVTFDDDILTKDNTITTKMPYESHSVIGMFGKNSQMLLDEFYDEFNVLINDLTFNNKIMFKELPNEQAFLNINRKTESNTGGFVIMSINSEGESVTTASKEEEYEETKKPKGTSFKLVNNPANKKDDNIDEILEKMFVWQ